jgi:hypothetical protein
LGRNDDRGILAPLETDGRIVDAGKGGEGKYDTHTIAKPRADGPVEQEILRVTAWREQQYK